MLEFIHARHDKTLRDGIPWDQRKSKTLPEDHQREKIPIWDEEHVSNAFYASSQTYIHVTPIPPATCRKMRMAITERGSEATPALVLYKQCWPVEPLLKLRLVGFISLEGVLTLSSKDGGFNVEIAVALILKFIISSRWL
jgi:hypothetical protein